MYVFVIANHFKYSVFSCAIISSLTEQKCFNAVHIYVLILFDTDHPCMQ